MKTVEYLNEHGMDSLKEELAIKVTEYSETNLYVLNYDQINSPKLHEVVRECRSLVVECVDGVWSVVSRSFDRFFNHGEVTSEHHPLHQYTAYEKLDGSLLSVFFHNNQWMYRTRSMIMPTTLVNGFGSTWKEFIEDALGWETLQGQLNPNNTYIFEVVGADNRVVVRYSERASYLLAIRNNSTGEYQKVVELDGIKQPRKFSFNSVEDCLESVKALPNLEEGYVMYDNKGVPQVKVKSPAYVAAHRLRGEGLTHKRVIELVRTNEYAEYLSIFPEDSDQIKPYIDAEKLMRVIVSDTFEANKDISCQKEFALAVKDFPFAGLLFSMRKGATLNDTIDNMTMPAYIRLIESFLLKQYKLEDKND